MSENLPCFVEESNSAFEDQSLRCGPEALGLAAMARSIFHDFRLILAFVKEYSDSSSHSFMWGEVI